MHKRHETIKIKQENQNLETPVTKIEAYLDIIGNTGEKGQIKERMHH